MSIFESGRSLGYTNQQIRTIVNEQKVLLEREKLIKEVLDCQNLEDVKILLIDWVDKGYICS